MKYSAKQTENNKAQGRPSKRKNNTLPSEVRRGGFFLQPLGMIENLTAKKDLSLFDINENIKSSLFLSDTRNRKVYLLPRQIRILEVLARRVYQEVVASGDPNLDKYLEELPEKMEKLSAQQQKALEKMKEEGKELSWRGDYNDGRDRPLLAHIDLIDMAEELYPGGKGGKQLKALETDLREMHMVFQEFRFPCEGRNGYFPLIMPFITMVEIGEVNGEGKMVHCMAKIQIGDAMLFRIKEAYIISPADLPERLRDEKCHTELFTLLVMLLQKEWYPKMKRAEAAAKSTKKKMEQEGVKDSDAIDAAVVKAADKELIYTEASFSIIQRVNSRPFLQKGYVRYERVESEFKRAGDALIRIGLIKWWRKTKTADGSLAYSFRLNEHWVSVPHFENSLHLLPEE